MVNLLQFKPKPKIRIEEEKKEEEKSVKVKKVNPHVILRRKERKEKPEKKRKKPSCLDCIDGKLLPDGEFKGKTLIHCYYWGIILHPHRARICGKFQAKRR